MTYSPLVVGHTDDYLEVFNYIVGTFIYKVILICLPAKEKSVEHETALGTSIPIRLRVHNKTEAKAEFTCRVIILFYYKKNYTFLDPGSLLMSKKRSRYHKINTDNTVVSHENRLQTSPI